MSKSSRVFGFSPARTPASTSTTVTTEIKRERCSGSGEVLDQTNSLNMPPEIRNQDIGIKEIVVTHFRVLLWKERSSSDRPQVSDPCLYVLDRFKLRIIQVCPRPAVFSRVLSSLSLWSSFSVASTTRRLRLPGGTREERLSATFFGKGNQSLSFSYRCAPFILYATQYTDTLISNNIQHSSIRSHVARNK